MELRVVAILLLMLSVMAASAVVLHALISLLGRLDPSAPLRAQIAARVDAIDATLRAIRLGLIKIPRVYRRVE